MIHNFTQISFKEHLTLLPLPMSVLQQTGWESKYRMADNQGMAPQQ
jgi:hypothetical protein